MKLAICGTRNMYVNSALFDELFNYYDLHPLDEIVSGGARGVDECAERYALDRGFKFKLFEADWEKYGKPAGHIRNKQIADYSDVLLLIWDGTSRGSANMKENMEKLGKPVWQVILKGPEKTNSKALNEEIDTIVGDNL